MADPIVRTADRAGLLGVIIAAMGCLNCFPAIASLGAAIGLGFLNRYEGLFIRILLPAFACLALLANGWGALRHRQWTRMALSVLGPLLVLASVYVMRATHHRTGWLFYPGLTLMVAVSLWDLFAARLWSRRSWQAN